MEMSNSSMTQDLGWKGYSAHPISAPQFHGSYKKHLLLKTVAISTLPELPPVLTPLPLMTQRNVPSSPFNILPSPHAAKQQPLIILIFPLQLKGLDGVTEGSLFPAEKHAALLWLQLCCWSLSSCSDFVGTLADWVFCCNCCLQFFKPVYLIHNSISLNMLFTPVCNNLLLYVFNQSLHTWDAVIWDGYGLAENIFLPPLIFLAIFALLHVLEFNRPLNWNRSFLRKTSEHL